MLAAIIGSTIFDGSLTMFSTERVSVIEWAKVNALMTLTKSHSVATASASAAMKSRWS